MKAIMISIKSRYCALIMNGKKTIEVRKNKALAKAIKKLIDENGYADIYVYCSKISKKHKHLIEVIDTDIGIPEYEIDLYFSSGDYLDSCYEGKVAFKFRCYKVEEIKFQILIKPPFLYTKIQELSCLEWYDLMRYLDDTDGYAIHISDLEIFDKPRELSEFKHYKKFVSYDYTYTKKYIERELRPLTKAPQNMVYIEIENSTARKLDLYKKEIKERIKNQQIYIKTVLDLLRNELEKDEPSESQIKQRIDEYFEGIAKKKALDSILDFIEGLEND